MASSILDQFEPVLIQMMKDPPSKDDVQYVGQLRPAMGLAISFNILSWIAVGLRLHTRFRVVREPGWDDLFVVIAAVVNLIGMVAFFKGIEHGIGLHLLYAIPDFKNLMKWYYVANATYTSTTMFIKMSLLLQYLRLYREGYRRTCTIILLVAVVLWGTAFSFMSWFPCFPIKGYWDKEMVPPAKCYGFGYRHVNEAKNTLLGFAGSNMCLDVLVFVIPLTEYFKPNIGRKQMIAMTGLFAMGSLVILMAILRLWSGLSHVHTRLEMYDFTFWMPEVLFFACLEIDFAIMCASMPIFWPTVVAQWTQIFVTKEVLVTHDRRSAYYSADDLELDRTASLKSHKSTEVLTRTESLNGKSFFYDFDPRTTAEPRLGPVVGQHSAQVKPML